MLVLFQRLGDTYFAPDVHSVTYTHRYELSALCCLALTSLAAMLAPVCKPGITMGFIRLMTA